MAKQEKLFRTTFTISAIIAVSKVVGFVRTMVVTYFFGKSIEASAYYAAYNYVSVFTLLFSVGVGSAFIPIYARKRLERGQRGADAYASNVLTLYILLGLAAGVLGWLLSTPLAQLLWRADEGRELVVQYSRCMFPFIVFYAVSGVLTNVLNARERFIPEQLMGFALSFTCIIACIMFGSVRSLALATGLTGVIQVLVLLPFTRGQFRYRPRLDFADGSLLMTFSVALPALVNMAFDEINHLFDKAIVTSIDATGLTPLNNSYLLVMTVLGVLVVPITTIMFSRLSRFAARADKRSMAENVSTSIELIAFITLPIIAVFLVASADIFGLLFDRGAWTLKDTLYTAPILSFYMLGVFTFGVRNFLVRVFYSLQDTRTPMIIGIFAVAINIALNYTLAVKCGLGVKGVSLATSLSGIIGAIALMAVIPGRLPLKMGRTTLEILKMLFCSIVALGTMFCIHHALEGLGVSALMRFGRLALMGLGGILSYALAATCLRVRSFDYAVGMLRRQ